ncbi:plasmid replication protein RepC [Pseudovibrio sp. SPO723]|uniref:plasmid replication protein RepC n=1 Tax=Nesiotobacter zosterae TaxID=392721 RepID=UPI0029C1DF23|nr:plasmid replication protein RepC [Pseudovibrio sp. SPO723]MDX5595505.1 plasmid replication protein RepC [Pseudovibrio sp. SPO723]
MQDSTGVASFRKLTPAMMRAQQLALANDIVETSKGEVAMALKKAAPALGIDGTCYHILDILIGLTVADDWRPNRKPIVAISNEKLAEYVCRSKRTVMRCLKRLVEAGVMAYRDSPTGRRYVHRGEFHKGKLGEIERGFGFDFSPARQRVAELKELGEAFARRLKQEKDARRTVNRLLRSIEDMAVLAANEGLDFSEVLHAVNQAKDAPMGIVQKAEVMQGLYEMALGAFAAQEAECDANACSSFEETPPAGDICDTPYNNTNPQSLENISIKRRSAHADPSNHEDPDKAGIKRAFEKAPNRKVRAKSSEPSQEDKLQNISVGLLKTALTELQVTLGVEFNRWQDVTAHTTEMALLIGLSQAGLAEAEKRAGGYVAAAVLATTAEKALRDPELISSPGGYFRACIDRAMDGELALHKSLFGLANGA